MVVELLLDLEVQDPVLEVLEAGPEDLEALDHLWIIINI
jgi:hypothetical protein